MNKEWKHHNKITHPLMYEDEKISFATNLSSPLVVV